MLGKKPVKELWAVVNEKGEVMYSRGGSSSSAKLLVYDRQYKAENAIKNRWIQQVLNGVNVTVKRIYCAEEHEKC